MSVRIESQSEPIPGYRLLDRLGSGGFGEVWRAEAPGGIHKAVKVIFGDLRSQDNDHIRFAEQELKSLKRVKQVRHPYLLALDRFDIVEGRLMIVMELADCNLWDRFRECRDRGLPGIPREELLVYMAETAEVLDLMNDQFGLQHLDIKPQNLFLLHNHVKVADFGQVKDLQGMLANVTGGITPVYAAPETFDGIVSRFCDQYSLACVYQELLTGQRPFDGTSMNQLLMQHLQLPPDLKPSPSCDRPVLQRALAKRAEDRWPSVSAFVRALREGAESQRSVRPSFQPAAAADGAVANQSRSRQILLEELTRPDGPAAAHVALETPWRKSSDETESHEPLPSLPEITGPGPLRPALIIGLGQFGLRVLQRLRFDLTEQYGPPEWTPLIRTLYIDTDAESLDEAGRPRPQERLAGLGPDEICRAELHRPGHYLNPRSNGRSVTEGWLDQQVLYRIPRTPHTMGLRLLGRLAFCDHYVTLVNRIHAELEAALAPESLAVTEERTDLGLGSSRPRVYIATGLAGGTGSGMLLDVAYCVRERLKTMGFSSPEVIGLFLVPPFDSAVQYPPALGNTYAALTEVHHYSQEDTAFTAQYEDRHDAIHDRGAPFSRYYILPGPEGSVQPTRVTPPGSGVVKLPRSSASGTIAKPGSRPRIPGLGSQAIPSGSQAIPRPDARPAPPASGARTAAEPLSASAKPFADAAAWIRLQLFCALGKSADEIRTAKLEEHGNNRPSFSTFGVAGFDWPRAEVVGRASLAVARTILKQWLTPSVHRAREVIPNLAAERWSQLGLDPETVRESLHGFAAEVIGDIERQVEVIAGRLATKGWRPKLPEPEQVAAAIDQLVRLVGPASALGKRGSTGIEDAVAECAAAAAKRYSQDLRKLGQSYVDRPEFRPAAAEEMLRQFHATTERLIDLCFQEAAEAAARAQASFDLLAQYIHYGKGKKKQAVSELDEALRGFARHRIEAIKFYYSYVLYRSIREILKGQLDEVSGCRQQLEQAAAAEPKLYAEVLGPRRLLPRGCTGVVEVAERFLDGLRPEDYAEIERRVQSTLESLYGGLFQASMSSSSGGAQVVALLRDEVRRHLDSRLGDVDLAALFRERFGTRPVAEAAISEAFAVAEPSIVGHGPWRDAEVVVVSTPGGQSGELVRELARCAIPVAGLPFTDSRDAITIYRELPAVPLSALPHLGPEGNAVYQALPESNQYSLHSRLDVIRWHHV